MSREEDIQKLCESILDISLDFFDNPNGGYEHSCPLCSKTIEDSEIGCSIATFPHHPDCAYYIAKDLLTK